MLDYSAPNCNAFLTFRNVNEDKRKDILVRSEFQRDRDRIVHSRAFRRLMHKTQIFNANKGDHYRNRLTHSLEVNQIARSIGKGLKLNDELIEAIALGHDLGHTPFGHVGERTLHMILQGDAFKKDDIRISGKQGFKHNFQSIQIIDNIETTSDKYDGMNLTLAVREGILKHTKRTMKLFVPDNKGNLVRRDDSIAYSCLDLKNMNINAPSFTLEGQVVAIADEIAQCTHDLEDGIRSEIIPIKDLKNIKLVQEVIKQRNIDFTRINSTVEARNQLIKVMVGFLIDDVYISSCERLSNKFDNQENVPCYKNIDDTYKELFVDFSDNIKELVEDLSAIKSHYILSSQIISQSDSKAEHLIKQLYKAYYKHPLQLPDYILKRYYLKKGIKLNRVEIAKEINLLQEDIEFQRLICDHIACMTDQFVEREYKLLYMPDYI